MPGEDEGSDEAVVYYLIEEKEGTLTAEQVARFRAHISSCAQCLKTYTRLRAFSDVLKERDEPKGPSKAIAGVNSK